MPAIHLTDRDLNTIAIALRTLQGQSTQFGVPAHHNVTATLAKIEAAQRLDKGVTP